VVETVSMIKELCVTFPAKHSLGSLYVAERAFPHQRKWIGDAKGTVDVKLAADKLFGLALGQLGTEGFSSMSSEDLSRINSLDFSASFFNEKTAQSASVLANSMPELLELRLDFLKLGARELSAAKNFQTVQTLWLTGTEIGDDVVEVIASQGNIVNLVIKKTRITDSGMTKLANMGNLQILNLPSQITDAGLQIIGGFPALTKLDASFTSITDPGIDHLSRLRTLTDLFLSDTKVTDAVFPYLLKIASLKTIFLSGTIVTDAGIVQLENLPQLEHLELRDTRATEMGIARLRQKLPNCAIFGP
jgi:Leucine-rich repeat (LRR) protein